MGHTQGSLIGVYAKPAMASIGNGTANNRSQRRQQLPDPDRSLGGESTVARPDPGRVVCHALGSPSPQSRDLLATRHDHRAGDDQRDFAIERRHLLIGELEVPRRLAVGAHRILGQERVLQALPVLRSTDLRRSQCRWRDDKIGRRLMGCTAASAVRVRRFLLMGMKHGDRRD